MIDAPLTNQLGKLSVSRVLFYYEGPRLFVAGSESGQSYIVICVDDDESSETYLYVPLPPDRLASVLAGREPLRSAIDFAPDDRVFVDRVRWEDGPAEHSGTWQKPVDLKRSWLPQEGAKLSIEKQAVEDELLLAAADGQQRHLFRVAHQAHRENEFGLGALGRIFYALQELVYSRTADLRAQSWSGKIPHEIRNLAELRVLDFSPGSIVVTTKFPDEDLLGTGPNKERANAALDLTVLLDKDSPLLTAWDNDPPHASLSPETAKRLVELLRALVQDRALLDTAIRQPSGRISRGHLSTNDARSMLKAIGRSNVQVDQLHFPRASLEGWNFTSARFTLRTEEGELVKGKLSEQLQRRTEAVEVGGGELYDAHCERVTRISNRTGKSWHEYTMTSIRSIGVA